MVSFKRPKQLSAASKLLRASARMPKWYQDEQKELHASKGGAHRSGESPGRDKRRDWKRGRKEDSPKKKIPALRVRRSCFYTLSKSVFVLDRHAAKTQTTINPGSCMTS